MQTNLNCNCPKPQFGMAVRIPVNKEEQKQIARFLQLNKKTNIRGWKQFKHEQNHVTSHDIAFDPVNNTALIIENRTNKLVEAFGPFREGNTGLHHFGCSKFPGRKLFAMIFNPKKFLPYNVCLAGERAKKLHIETLKKEIDLKNL